jgi:hypothetical protein
MIEESGDGVMVFKRVDEGDETVLEVGCLSWGEMGRLA